MIKVFLLSAALLGAVLWAEGSHGVNEDFRALENSGLIELKGERVPARYRELLELQKEKETDILIVDFYADYCGPCQRFTNELKDLMKAYQDKRVKVIKVDYESAQEFYNHSEYPVRTLPTWVILKKDKTKEWKFQEMKTGFAKQDVVKNVVEKYRKH